MNIIVTIVIIICLSVLLFNMYTYEGFRSCPCDGDVGVLPRNGLTVINPFIAPYSSTMCTDDLYILAQDAGKKNMYIDGPLQHLNSPDHVVLTN